MNLITVIILALGLCFDSFAVSLSHGMSQNGVAKAHFFRFSLVLAFFQGVLPLIGWGLVSRFEPYIERFDHWIAFLLLALLGIKMIRESLKPEDPEAVDNFHFDFKHTVLLGIATSIDALITGAAMAVLTIEILKTPAQFPNMLTASGIIFLVTFLSCVTGILLGRTAGNKMGKYAEISGGIILIAIGVKVMIEHLYIG